MGLAWVPVDTCRLPTDEQPMRLAAFEDLFATKVLAVERTAPTRLRLDLEAEPETAARVGELALREADCCGFFTFTLTAAQGTLTLEVSVPAQRAGVLDGLADQARRAAS
ncbi:hypothetical protein GFD30_15090 [Glycomyces sp. NEAU-7082]|uniref:Arsenate reductase n=1 Tax=Glycomyces albidus TaxID=2656774 RepID=A0A6L5GBC4_9ACTN|nr:hypothetical protein [Glycomyces albidus]